MFVLFHNIMNTENINNCQLLCLSRPCWVALKQFFTFWNFVDFKLQEKVPVWLGELGLRFSQVENKILLKLLFLRIFSHLNSLKSSYLVFSMQTSKWVKKWGYIANPGDSWERKTQLKIAHLKEIEQRENLITISYRTNSNIKGSKQPSVHKVWDGSERGCQRQKSTKFHPNCVTVIYLLWKQLSLNTWTLWQNLSLLNDVMKRISLPNWT